jgi:hypothetical protein
MLFPARQVRAEDLSTRVHSAVEQAKSFLVNKQQNDGSWAAQTRAQWQTGITSVVLLALINAGMTADDPVIERGLNYLRALKQPKVVTTYEISLMIMVFAAAKDGQRDKARILTLAHNLEAGQRKRGDYAGCWSYFCVKTPLDARNSGRNGDHSNSQFAILGLRDAAHAGVQVDRQIWKRAEHHWRTHQNADGGWGYHVKSSSSGSMTVAGIATLVITDSMLQEDKDLNADGTPSCCPDEKPDRALERGHHWMENRFSVGHNPGHSAWLLYYLYGLERAGRLSGRRFFGEHDWYREGAKFLVDRQHRRQGYWPGVGGMEKDPVVGTSLALLFLSKGLAPVLINKLQYGPPAAGRGNETQQSNWNVYPHDVRNLTELISGLPKWPKLLTWQVVELDKMVQHGGVEDLLQSPVLYLSGRDVPQILDQPRQVELLKEYVNQGGFLFAVANCNSAGFDDGIRELVRHMFPGGEANLRPLKADHPIFRSEYLLDPETVALEGAEFGCRTAIVYSPTDLSCLWDKWALQDPPRRNAKAKAMITKATRIGVNVVAYATGRELADKLTQQERHNVDEKPQDRVERGLVKIAKLRHTGEWDVAPRALRNLLLALNETVGLAASPKTKNLLASDRNIFRYPLVYMHGRNRFQLSKQEREQLALYLERGGLLFADACCGAPQFDRSFRDLMAQLFPDRSLKRIPPKHELFTAQVGHEIREVRRRVPAADGANLELTSVLKKGEPFLEGIEFDGRFAVVYSKYDISCALEHQASLACSGYLPEDAMKIAVNVVLYGLLQDVGDRVSQQ